ncbi:MAG: hypothetical protein IJ205_01715 [Bacteroidales bacterium]|nr:hypothetical protein [Bacteroidales bacterium]
MKRILLSVIAVIVIAAGAMAQEKIKRFENIFQVGGGLFLESGTYDSGNNPGAALRLSYGLDIKFNECWSIMPGIGAAGMLGDVRHWGWVGGDVDDYSCLDAFCDVRFDIQSDGSRIVLGLGPCFYYSKNSDTYYIDHDPMDPRNSDIKFWNHGYGLRPSIFFEHGRHFKWGFEGNIGLRNMRIPYPEHNITGKTRFNNIMVVAAFGF